MEMDRDLGEAVAPELNPDGAGAALTGWDMLAATGIRGLRLLYEARAFRLMVFTERNPASFAVLEQNVARFRPAGAQCIRHDARRPVGRGVFDYVDLDPFGTPVPFVPAALGGLKDEGVLGIAATDLPVLAGVMPAACRKRYGALPLRGRLGPEGGLRILLAYLSSIASSVGRSIEPMLAYVLGHHVRAYVRVHRGPSTENSVGTIVEGNRDGPPVPAGVSFGPMWLGPLFDVEFVHRLRLPATAARPRELQRFLERIQGEAGIDVPLAYEPNELARALRLKEPPALDRLLGHLSKAGFRAARSHVHPAAFRTDAPRTVVEDAARAVSQR